MNYIICACLLTGSMMLSSGLGGVAGSRTRPEVKTLHRETQEADLPESGFVYKYQEPGNPDHKEPTQHCSDTKRPNHVACSCNQSCDKPENDQACKSYCFRKYCSCHPEGCD